MVAAGMGLFLPLKYPRYISRCFYRIIYLQIQPVRESRAVAIETFFCPSSPLPLFLFVCIFQVGVRVFPAIRREHRGECEGGEEVYRPEVLFPADRSLWQVSERVNGWTGYCCTTTMAFVTLCRRSFVRTVLLGVWCCCRIAVWLPVLRTWVSPLALEGWKVAE